MNIVDMTWDARKIVALNHFNHVVEEYNNEVQHCIDNTTYYGENEEFEIPAAPRFPTTGVRFRTFTTEEALNNLNLGNMKIAVLNFSDYVKPAGKFLDGSIAQEESLCHHSILAPVLEHFRYSFYVRNKESGLLGGMYRNRMLYTKDVLFFLPDKQFKVDVITCAAPNFTSGLRYGSVTKECCDAVMEERLEFIFKAAIVNKVDCLFIGAYGCGVFKNDPDHVSKVILKLCEKYEGHIKFVVCPVPNGGRCPQNWHAFTNNMFGHRLSDL